MSIYSYRLRQVVQDSFALFVDRISPRTSDDEALEDLQVAGGRGKMQCSDGILVDLVDEGTLLEQGGHTPRMPSTGRDHERREATVPQGLSLLKSVEGAELQRLPDVDVCTGCEASLDDGAISGSAS
eukprot:CAMPEP_0115139194 /NCGR_PEP_ID=MMETSP0227-20121206/58135_1 /TAXON_ID=89957 /ORGANISM="Polarella glacialis, Strain CCMP 1383" /LENGTH=126 /DNA_ID=CAMNT_0002546995 /DNA_START=168 /DNA_END=548 /DNA_ORIENTATION=-